MAFFCIHRLVGTGTMKSLTTGLESREKAEAVYKCKNIKLCIKWTRTIAPHSLWKKFQIRSIESISIWKILIVILLCDLTFYPWKAFFLPSIGTISLHWLVIICVHLVYIFPFRCMIIHLSLVGMWNAQLIPRKSSKYAYHSCHVIHSIVVWKRNSPGWTLAP